MWQGSTYLLRLSHLVLSHLEFCGRLCSAKMSFRLLVGGLLWKGLFIPQATAKCREQHNSRNRKCLLCPMNKFSRLWCALLLCHC